MEKTSTEIRQSFDVLPNKVIDPSKLSIQQLLTNLLNDLDETSPRKASGLQEDVNLDDRIKTVIVTEHVLLNAERKKWPIARFNQAYFIFNGIYWLSVPEDDLVDFLGKAAEKINIDRYTARHFRFRENLIKQFHSSSYFQPPEQEKGRTMINLQNGTFVIENDRQFLRPFAQRDFLQYCLPFAYEPVAEAPKFQAFLDRVLPDPAKQKVLAEYIGYIFIKNSVLKLEKVLILYGSGMNGKSVFFDVIMALLGSENISNFGLQSLTDNTGYSRAALTGKLLNYASEISSKLNTTVFKQLISGEPVEARQIYGKPFVVTDYCRFIFNTNQLPHDTEINHAFFRRFLIVHFDQTISPAEKDLNLSSYLISNELPGIFNWVLEGLRRLLQQQDFSPCSAIDSAISQFKVQSDSVSLFLEEEGYIPSTTDSIPLKELFTKYKEFCKENLYSPCSNKTVADRLRGYGIMLTRKNSGNIVHIQKSEKG